MTEGTLMVVRQKSPHAVAGVQVLEGDVKAEGTLTFESLTITPATLAIWVAASRQALRDVAGLSMIIDNSLIYAVEVLEEQEILNGDGTPGHLHGIMPQAPALAAVTRDTALDALARGIAALAASGVKATGAVLNPADWLSVMLAKTTVESYLLGSPASATAALVWGVPLALSTAMTPGSFLVGNFVLGAELAYRESAVIDISTEHSEFFTKNLICVRAEESLALAVKQPSYFLKSTLPAPVAAAAEARANGGRK
jgi:HK97 family phage major capsid protein